MMDSRIGFTSSHKPPAWKRLALVIRYSAPRGHTFCQAAVLLPFSRIMAVRQQLGRYVKTQVKSY